MRLIVGLGNPGKKYQKTRHNLGFRVLDEMVKKKKLLPFRLENQFQAEITQTGGIGESRIILAKPQTYMNNSGQAVSKLLNYYKIGIDDLVVICDDLDLELGSIRLRNEGSSGGHKGLESIIQEIGDSRFARVRMGIGSNKEEGISSEKYVLQKFNPEEKKIIQKVIDKTAKIVINLIDRGEIKEETIKI